MGFAEVKVHIFLSKIPPFMWFSHQCVTPVYTTLPAATLSEPGYCNQLRYPASFLIPEAFPVFPVFLIKLYKSVDLV